MAGISFEDLLDMPDEEVEMIMKNVETYKAERKRFNKESLLKLPKNPPLLLDCIHYLRVNNGITSEGIFRVNGDSHVVDKLRSSFVNDVDMNDILLSLQQSITLKNYDIATALKSYFRLLKDPLVPHDTYDALKACLNDPDCLNLFKKEIGKIREPNKSLLAFTMMFFQDIVENKEVNKMGSTNLATCLTMSILRFKDTGTNHFAAMMEVGVSTKIITMMLNDIDYTDYISPARYLQLLQGTTYKRNLLPNSVEEFEEHEQFAKFKKKYDAVIKPTKKRALPVMPERKQKPKPVEVDTVVELDDADI